jgi:hypothetical protein
MITEFVKKYIAVPQTRHVLLSACFSETRPTVLLICAYEEADVVYIQFAHIAHAERVLQVACSVLKIMTAVSLGRKAFHTKYDQHGTHAGSDLGANSTLPAQIFPANVQSAAYI